MKSWRCSVGACHRPTPRATVRAALGAQLLTDGDTWMRALDARNAMLHTYDPRSFERVVGDLRAEYLGLFDALYARLEPLTWEASGD